MKQIAGLIVSRDDQHGEAVVDRFPATEEARARAAIQLLITLGQPFNITKLEIHDGAGYTTSWRAPLRLAPPTPDE